MEITMAATTAYYQHIIDLHMARTYHKARATHLENYRQSLHEKKTLTRPERNETFD